MVGCWLALGMAAAGLASAGWPGTPAGPATLINRVEVIAAPVLLTSARWAAGRVFGPAGRNWLARIVRAGGYAAVFTLVLVKAEVERSEYAALRGGPWLAGLWVGEIIFLAVMAAYVAGITAVTARRTPASPAALATGALAGAGAGLVMTVLPPMGNPLHLTGAWLTVVHGLARGVAVPLVLGGGVAAGLMAARRTSLGGSRLPLSEVRARQGVAAGVCAGVAAALVVSVTGVSTAALLPYRPKSLPPALADLRHIPASVQAFEVSLGRSAAGYLIVLVFLPLVGAGLGAWGGLCAAGRAARPPGGGGGGGWSPRPGPTPPPAGGRVRSEDRQPAILAEYLLQLPDGAIPSEEEDENAPPARRERIPVGAGRRAAMRSPPRGRTSPHCYSHLKNRRARKPKSAFLSACLSGARCLCSATPAAVLASKK
jgi:hypothetical protein